MVNQFYLNQKVEIKTKKGLQRAEVLDYNANLNQYLVVLNGGGHMMVSIDKIQPFYERKVRKQHEHV